MGAIFRISKLGVAEDFGKKFPKSSGFSVRSGLTNIVGASFSIQIKGGIRHRRENLVQRGDEIFFRLPFQLLHLQGSSRLCRSSLGGC